MRRLLVPAFSSILVLGAVGLTADGAIAQDRSQTGPAYGQGGPDWTSFGREQFRRGYEAGRADYHQQLYGGQREHSYGYNQGGKPDDSLFGPGPYQGQAVHGRQGGTGYSIQGRAGSGVDPSLEPALQAAQQVRQALEQGDTAGAQQALSDLEDALGGDPQQRLQRMLSRIETAIDSNELDDARRSLQQVRQALGIMPPQRTGAEQGQSASQTRSGSTDQGRLQQTLSELGYRNVRIVDAAYLIRALSPSGDQVTMLIDSPSVPTPANATIGSEESGTAAGSAGTATDGSTSLDITGRPDNQGAASGDDSQ